jgi:hypothetical protein
LFFFFLSPQWVLESKFESFVKEVQTRYDAEISLRCVAFGNSTWFGFWEGQIGEGMPSAWGARSKIVEFVDHVRVCPVDKKNKERKKRGGVCGRKRARVDFLPSFSSFFLPQTCTHARTRTY